MNMHTTIVAAVPQVSQSDWYEMLATRDSSARDLKHYNDTVLLPLEDGGQGNRQFKRRSAFRH